MRLRGLGHLQLHVRCGVSAAWLPPGAPHRPACNRALRCAVQDLPYWGSWALTHFGQLAVTVLLCTLALIYPFPNSNPSVYTALLLAESGALIAFSYAASTIFARAKVGAARPHPCPAHRACNTLPGTLCAAGRTVLLLDVALPAAQAPGNLAISEGTLGTASATCVAPAPPAQDALRAAPR